jgi:hypothetical protein
MPVLRFLDWTPDAADLGSTGAITATNALPSRDGYQPFKSLSIVTGATSTRPLGGIEEYGSDGTSYQYVGDTQNLYELNDNDLTWTDISGATYTTAAGEVWEFCRGQLFRQPAASHAWRCELFRPDHRIEGPPHYRSA